MAHNEDAAPNIKPSAYIVQAQLQWLENSTQASRYTAYTYPGYLSGMAWGFNQHIVVTCNACFPKKVVLPGVIRYFLNRDLLASNSTEDALNRLHIPNLALGFSTNIGGIPTGDKAPDLYNVEVAQTNVDILKVSADNFTEHFNMYLRLDVPQYTDTSSVYRLKRAQQMGPPKDMHDMLLILGDTENKQWPIFRDAVPPDSAATVATAAFNLVNKTAYIYQANPKISTPVYFFLLE